MPTSPVFHRLFTEHRGSVVRYLRRRLGDETAEDAAVQTFRHAARRIDAPAGRGAPRPWLYGLATQAVTERWRSERARLEALEGCTRRPPILHPALEPARPLEPPVAHALRCLPAAVRETLLLIAWGELSASDAAAALGVSVPVVHDRLGAARAHVVAHAGPADGTASVREPTTGVDELLRVLTDNADLGLDPVRQPRIESALSRRLAAAPHGSLPPGRPPVLDG